MKRVLIRSSLAELPQHQCSVWLEGCMFLPIIGTGIWHLTGPICKTHIHTFTLHLLDGSFRVRNKTQKSRRKRCRHVKSLHISTDWRRRIAGEHSLAPLENRSHLLIGLLCGWWQPPNPPKYYEAVRGPNPVSNQNKKRGWNGKERNNSVDTANLLLIDYDKDPFLVLWLWLWVCECVDSPGKEIIVLWWKMEPVCACVCEMATVNLGHMFLLEFKFWYEGLQQLISPSVFSFGDMRGFLNKLRGVLSQQSFRC